MTNRSSSGNKNGGALTSRAVSPLSPLRSVTEFRRSYEPQIAKIFAAVTILIASVAAGGRLQCLNAADARTDTAHDNGLAQLAADKTEWKTFRDPNLRIEFSYPNNRKVTMGCHFSNNCVALIAKFMRPGDYLVAFEVFDGALDAVAVEQAVFQKEGDHWIAKGRNAKHPVEPLSGSGWQGLKSVVDCGISDSTGSHAGAGECLWVVASDGKRSIVAETQGTVPIDQDTMRSILSLRFSAP